MTEAKQEGRLVPLQGEVKAESSVGIADLVIVKVTTKQLDGTVRTDFVLSDAAQQSLNTGSGKL